MPRIATPLTDTKIKAAKPRSDNRDNVLIDGGGLILRVKPNGSKLWYLNYQKPHCKKRNNKSLGRYPELSLSDARALREKCKKALQKGIDPKDLLNDEKENKYLQHKNTFLEVAKGWYEIKKSNVTERHAIKVWQSLERHIFPDLGNTPIHIISAPDVIQILRPLEARGTLETVSRMCRRVNEVMNFAVNSGIIHFNPLISISEVFKKPKPKHYPSIKPDELGEFLNSLNNGSMKTVTKQLILWQLHTMVRPGEAVKARWCDIDIDEKLWVVPFEFMKKKKEHKVPLSSHTLKILNFMKVISGHREYVFPGHTNPNSHANASTANMAVKRLGYSGKLVAHGMRSIASTALNERGFDEDLIEVCLAHIDKNKVRKAYNRAEYLEKRREIMEWWSNYVVKQGIE